MIVVGIHHRARSIHRDHGKRRGPLVAVPDAAELLPGNLLNVGELFRAQHPPPAVRPAPSWRVNLADPHADEIAERGRDVVRLADDLLITDENPGKDPFAALPEPFPGFKLDTFLTQAREQLFLRALAACKGNQTEAAELLGVSKQAVNKFVAGQNDNEN